MSSGVYILPGTQSFTSLETTDEHSENAERNVVEGVSNAAQVTNQSSRTDLLGLIPYQLFNPQASTRTEAGSVTEGVSTRNSAPLSSLGNCWPLVSSPKANQQDTSCNALEISRSGLNDSSCGSLATDAPSVDGLLPYITEACTNFQPSSLPQKKRDCSRHVGGKNDSLSEKARQRSAGLGSVTEYETYVRNLSHTPQNPTDLNKSSCPSQEFASSSFVSPQSILSDCYPTTRSKLHAFHRPIPPSAGQSHKVTPSNRLSIKQPSSGVGRFSSQSTHLSKRSTKLESGKQCAVSSSSSLCRSSYMCRKCRAHGKLLPVKQHKRNCPFRNCTCPVCSLVNYGRHIVAKQIALYRDQKNHQLPTTATTISGDINRRLTNPPVTTPVALKFHANDGASHPYTTNKMLDSVNEDEGPHCRRCRNHGKNNPWKGHKKTCPYRYCICQQCILISLRKSNEKNLREVVQEYFDERVDKREKFQTNKPPRQAFQPTDSASDHVQSGTAAGPEDVSTVSDYFHSINGQVPFPSLGGLKTSRSLFSHSYLSKLTEAYNQTRMVLAPGFATSSTIPHPNEQNLFQTFLPSTSIASSDSQSHTTPRLPELISPDSSMKTNSKVPFQPERPAAGRACRTIYSKPIDMDSAYPPSTLFSQPGFPLDGVLSLTDPHQSLFHNIQHDYNAYSSYNLRPFDAHLVNEKFTTNAQLFHGYNCSDQGIPLFGASGLDTVHHDMNAAHDHLRDSASGSWSEDAGQVDLYVSAKSKRDVNFRSLVGYVPSDIQNRVLPFDSSSTCVVSGESNSIEQSNKWDQTQPSERPDFLATASNFDGQAQHCVDIDPSNSSLDNQEYQTRAAAFAAAAAAAVAFHQEVAQHSTRKSDCINHSGAYRSSTFDGYRSHEGQHNPVDSALASDYFSMSSAFYYPHFGSLGFPTSFVQATGAYGLASEPLVQSFGSESQYDRNTESEISHAEPKTKGSFYTENGDTQLRDNSAIASMDHQLSLVSHTDSNHQWSSKREDSMETLDHKWNHSNHLPFQQNSGCRSVVPRIESNKLTISSASLHASKCEEQGFVACTNVGTQSRSSSLPNGVHEPVDSTGLENQKLVETGLQSTTSSVPNSDGVDEVSWPDPNIGLPQVSVVASGQSVITTARNAKNQWINTP